MTTPIRTALGIALTGFLLLALPACTIGPGASPVTDTPVGGGTSGTSGSSTGSPGVEPSASVGGVLPEPGSPTLVVPSPGRLQPHRVGATAVEARVVGGRVGARLTWWSGVAPCNVLDSIIVERAERRIRLTIVEGADRLDVACIEIAMLKASDVDLGVLDPGVWTITAYGEAPPVTVTVP